jgi:hypothetical protein
MTSTLGRFTRVVVSKASFEVSFEVSLSSLVVEVNATDLLRWSACVGVELHRTQRLDARHLPRFWPWNSFRRATSRHGAAPFATETRLDAEMHAAPIVRVMLMTAVAARAAEW